MAWARRAPAATALGQLQRGRGLGWLAARDAPDGHALLEACLAWDPRWDAQVESRAGYYAGLALTIGYPAAGIDPEAVEDEHTKWLRVEVLGEMAERGDPPALALLRDRVRPGPDSEDVIWQLAGLSGGRGLEGLLGLILERHDDEQLRGLVADGPRGVPWDEWGEASERVRRAVRAADEERSRRGVRPSPPLDAPIDVILAHDWGGVPPKALVHRLVNLASPAEVEAIREAAARPWDTRRRLAMVVLGERRDPSAVIAAEDVFIRGVRGGERSSAVRYLSALDPSVTLPIARRWLAEDDDRQNMAAHVMALHAEPVDAARIREVLAESIRSDEMYVLCDLVDALSRLAAVGPFPELRVIFEETVYSYARCRAALAMAATDPGFPERYATECLWDCEGETREAGVAHAPRTAPVLARLQELSAEGTEGHQGANGS